MGVMRINWRLVVGVLIIQTLLGMAEAVNVLVCHIGGGECWTWFFTFGLNMPSSIPVMKLIGSISSYTDSFYPVWAISLVMFLLAGTVQWSLIFHFIVLALVPLKQVLRKNL